MICIRKFKCVLVTESYVLQMIVERSISSRKSLTWDTLNPNLKAMKESRRNILVERINKLQSQVNKGFKKPYEKMINLSTDDPQSLGQKPLTFLRQLILLVLFPRLMENGKYPKDVEIRAKEILSDCPGRSIGCYSEGAGMEIVRRKIAQFIEERDNCPSKWTKCVLGHGVCDLVRKVLNILKIDMNGLEPGILNPIPEYTPFSLSMTEIGMNKIDYYLDEENEWRVDINELQRAINDARIYCNPRAIIIINPGNPTSRILTRQNIEEIIRFAYRENIIIIADEVLQTNVITKNKKFISFKKVLTELPHPFNTVELVSLMSASKGYFGECGYKGGYAEFINFDPDVIFMFEKSCSMLLPSGLGQTAVYGMVNPPKPEEPSFEQFQYEKDNILKALKLSATLAEEVFNSLDGVECQSIEGASFAYPRIEIPQGAVNMAYKLGISPDEFYSLNLLEETGIYVLPGSKLGQNSDNFHHIRMSVSIEPSKMHQLMELYGKFHQKFLNEFSSIRHTN